MLQSPIRNSHSVVCGLYSAIPISPHAVCFLVVLFLRSLRRPFFGVRGLGWHFSCSANFSSFCAASDCLSSSAVASSFSDVFGSAAVWGPAFLFGSRGCSSRWIVVFCRFPFFLIFLVQLVVSCLRRVVGFRRSWSD